MRVVDTKGFKQPAAAVLNPGSSPMLQWIKICDLVVDPSYQRDIRGEGRRNIQKIADGFRWSSFAPVIVSPVVGGKFAIVDGQHRTTAAAVCGVDAVPCQVIIATKAEQAAAFRAVNGAVTKMSRQQLHAAAVIAGETRAVEIEDVCKRAGVTVLRYPVSADLQQPGQTMAVGCIDECLRVYGRDVLVSALHCVTETANRENTGLLTSHIIRGLCEVLASTPPWLNAGEKLLTAFDDIDIGAEFEAARLMPRPKGTSIANNFAGRVRALLTSALGGE